MFTLAAFDQVKRFLPIEFEPKNYRQLIYG